MKTFIHTHKEHLFLSVEQLFDNVIVSDATKSCYSLAYLNNEYNCGLCYIRNNQNNLSFFEITFYIK